MSIVSAGEIDTGRRTLLDGVAAFVNSQVITVGEVAELIAPVSRQLQRNYSGEELKEKIRQAYDDALDTLVARQLIIDAYEEGEGTIPEWIVDRRIEEIIRTTCKGERAVLIEKLAEDRMSFEDFRRRVKEGLVVAAMRNEMVGRHVAPSPESLLKAYEENKARYVQPGKVKLRMIVLEGRSAGTDMKSVRDEAQKILARLDNGESFSTLARKISTGAKADAGGDWGWVEPSNVLRKELADAVSSLDPGEISRVIEIENQLYILKLEGRREAAPAEFSDVQQQITREVRQEEYKRLFDAWIHRLKEHAYIRIFQDVRERI